jgi:hypothetical protein
VREGKLNGKLVAVKTPSLEDAHHSSESSYEDSCDKLEEELDVYLVIASLPGVHPNTYILADTLHT